MDENKEVKQIPVEDIVPNRFQPRINFDEKALIDLSNSIKQHGIIQPLVVRPLGNKFEIIAGERRYKAATMAGLAKVPAIITEMDDSTSAEVALIENVQRKDLTAIEEAKSYKNMLDRGNITQEELAKKMGLAQSTIANKLRLLNLCEEVQDALMNEKISERHARALLSVPNKEEQVKWLNRIINERLTVRQLDLAIKDELNEKKVEAQSENDIPIVDINPDIDSIIANASDINTVEEKPDVNVFEGLENINNMNSNMTENIQPVVDENVEETVSEPVNETNEVPNKFFNFLEDEQANMNMEEAPASEPQIENVNSSEEVFSFSPEFSDNTVVENNVDDQAINNNDQFTQFDMNNQYQPVQPEVETVDSLDMLDVDNLGNAPETESVYNVDNSIIDQPIEMNNEIVSPEGIYNEPQVQEIPAVEPYSEPVNVQENVYFTQPIVTDNVAQVEPAEEIMDNNVYQPETAPVNDFVAEPIPVVEDENVLDPVKLFDTLEPDFYEKLKENAGIDLKTAINKYRDITTDLINRGFNISIDEIDEENIYKIEININKE